LIVRKLEPSFTALVLRKDDIVLSLEIIGDVVCAGWVDHRIDVIDCEIEVAILAH